MPRIYQALIFLAALLAWVSIAPGSSAETPGNEKCKEIGTEGIKALRAKDEKQIEQFETDLAQACSQVLPPRLLALQYSGIAWVYDDLGKSEKAMVASDRCIETDKDLPDCHVARGRALMALGNRVEAIEAVTNAKHIAQVCIDHETAEVRDASDPQVKEEHELWLKGCRAALGLSIDMLKLVGVDEEKNSEPSPQKSPQ